MSSGPAKPSADAQPRITDELPTVATAPLNGTPGDSAAARNSAGLITTGDDNVARVDRILRERAAAQQNADDLQELGGTAAKPKPEHVAVSAPLPAERSPLPPGEMPVYDPASDSEAIAQLIAAAEPPAVEVPVQAQPDVGDRVDQPPQANIEKPVSILLDRSRTPSGQPVAIDPTISRQSTLDPFLAIEQQYAGRVEHDPSNLNSQLDYQLLQFLRGERQAPKPDAMAGLSSDDQTLLSAMCDALSNFRSVVRTQPNAMAIEKARPFMEMAERISSQSDLAVSSPTLCEEVSAFGSYSPLDPTRFVAGQPVPAVFYCEVDGFQPMLNELQQYETKLSLELKLFSASRELKMWSLPTMTVNDLSRRRRRDFFIAKMIEIPPQPADTYLLKAIVKDLQGNRVAEKSLQFTLSNPVRR